MWLYVYSKDSVVVVCWHFTCAKEDTLFLHCIATSNGEALAPSVAYLHLCLLYSSVGQTPDNNEGQYSNYEELTFSVVHAS